jgi:exonuclease V
MLKRLVGNRLYESTSVTTEVPPEDHASIEPKPPDTRSPLERFRTPPKKGLSVTDLISPAWCELQYWYSLTLHGKKRRTPAMKQGSVVHQKLEDQIYTTVKVDVTTKEDGWGLRIWNVVQGLRTLRNTGMTRELEIWGTIDGLVVNGVIDELSYICPDTDLEESALKGPVEEQHAPDQTTIAEFFHTSGATSIKEATMQRSKHRAPTNKVYLCDVKTRGVKTLPSGAAFRPTRMQLMLYHGLIAALATNTVDFSVFTSRYNLDPTKVFSDSFIAQVSSLNDQSQSSAQESSYSDGPTATQDDMTILLEHNTISLLWGFMISEFQLTFPNGTDSLGSILKAEYRSRNAGEVIGSKTFKMDEGELTRYIEDEMRWWKGEREAKGVAVEEAYKCRSCEFAEGCEWRIGKVEEALTKSRMGTRTRSSV